MAGTKVLINADVTIPQVDALGIMSVPGEAMVVYVAHYGLKEAGCSPKPQTVRLNNEMLPEAPTDADLEEEAWQCIGREVGMSYPEFIYALAEVQTLVVTKAVVRTTKRS